MKYAQASQKHLTLDPVHKVLGAKLISWLSRDQGKCSSRQNKLNILDPSDKSPKTMAPTHNQINPRLSRDSFDVQHLPRLGTREVGLAQHFQPLCPCDFPPPEAPLLCPGLGSLNCCRRQRGAGTEAPRQAREGIRPHRHPRTSSPLPGRRPRAPVPVTPLRWSRVRPG